MPLRLSDRAGRLTVGATAIGLAVALAVATGYFRSLSGFQPYDDEGHLMLGVRHLLEGQTLYATIATFYGPLYYLEKWLLHGPFGIPLTHTAVRLTFAATYVVTACVGAAAVFRMTRSFAAAVLALVLIQVPLSRFANEPGHPQEVATLLLAALPLAAAAARPATRNLFLGLLVGGIVMTKVNVGAFAAIAVGLALLAPVPGLPGRALRTVGVLVAAALPWIIMRQATVPGTVPLSVIVSTWVVTVALVAAGEDRGFRRFRTGAVGLSLFLVAAAVTVGALVAFACSKGATPSAIWDALIVRPQEISGGTTLGMPVYSGTWGMTAAGLLGAAAWVRWRAVPSAPVVVAVVQLFVGAAIWHQLGQIGFIGLLPPWAWLVLVREGGAAPAARLVVAWLAVLAPLQIYPVPGSQGASGAVPGLLAAIVTLSDGIAGLRRALQPTVARHAAAAARALLLVAALWSGWFTVYGVRIAYDALTPLDLRGTEGVRTGQNDARMFQQLVRAVEDNCRLLLTVPGLPSMHFWTDARPPTMDLFGHTIHAFRPERLAVIQAVARLTPGLCILLGPPRFGFESEEEFRKSLVAQMALIKSIDHYGLFMRPVEPPPATAPAPSLLPRPGPAPSPVPNPAR